MQQRQQTARSQQQEGRGAEPHLTQHGRPGGRVTTFAGAAGARRARSRAGAAEADGVDGRRRPRRLWRPPRAVPVGLRKAAAYGAKVATALIAGAQP